MSGPKVHPHCKLTCSVYKSPFLLQKVYKTVVRPPMMYSAETWAVKKAQEKKLDVAEMRMSGVTKMDRIRNERIRGTTKVGEISKKIQESRA